MKKMVFQPRKRKWRDNPSEELPSISKDSPVSTEKTKKAEDENPRRDICTNCKKMKKTDSFGVVEKVLSCTGCTVSCHPSCHSYSLEMARRLSSFHSNGYPWQCPDCKTCSICQSEVAPDTLLLCDGCDQGFHMACHRPVLQSHPHGRWLCGGCEISEVRIPENVAGDKSPSSSFLNVKEWSVNDVVSYCTDEGLGFLSATIREHEIDGSSVLLLSRQDILKSLDLKMGPALKLAHVIKQLQDKAAPLD